MPILEQPPDRRAELIADLHAFADLLATRPDMPAPRHVNAQYTVLHHDFPSDADRVAEVERIAALLGVDVERDEQHATARLPLGRVEYVVHALTSEGSARWDAERSYAGAVEPDMAVA